LLAFGSARETAGIAISAMRQTNETKLAIEEVVLNGDTPNRAGALKSGDIRIVDAPQHLMA
jgi:hypothetical protein